MEPNFAAQPLVPRSVQHGAFFFELDDKSRNPFCVEPFLKLDNEFRNLLDADPLLEAETRAPQAVSEAATPWPRTCKEAAAFRKLALGGKWYQVEGHSGGIPEYRIRGREAAKKRNVAFFTPLQPVCCRCLSWLTVARASARRK